MHIVSGKAKKGVFSTGRLMRRLSVAFAGDVDPYLTLSLPAFYARVRDVPYRRDPASMEFLQRPAVTLAGTGPGGDCDDKAVALAAYLCRQGIPYRFVAAGRDRRNPLHHTWVQAKLEGEWVDLDPTYAWNSPGQRIGRWEKIIVIG